jgi:exodeoxyribonuclease-5
MAADDPADKLSSQQQEAIDKIRSWHAAKNRQVFLLEGPAGTGKTTLIRRIGPLLGESHVAYAAFTGKAAHVMRNKGCANATTIHGLIYTPSITYICTASPPCASPPCTNATAGRCPRVRERPADWVRNPAGPIANAGVIVIDEVSMVGVELGRDLLSFGKPVLVIGDRNQLPPIDGGGFFTSGEPDYALTEIHRQEAGSPIVQLATNARLGIPLRCDQYNDGSVVTTHDQLPIDSLTTFDQIICGRHASRGTLNRTVRKLVGLAEGTPPQVGEKVICLKNSRFKGLYNGSLWTIAAIAPTKHDGFYRMTVQDDDDRNVDVVAPIAAFGLLDNSGNTYPGEPFDWGYAITCHKSQGSQWDNVCVFDESSCWRRDNQHTNWLYTAITRAAKRITITQRPRRPAAVIEA